MRAHRFEITIPMQKLIATPDAERADDNIEGLAGRLAQCAQRAIKPRGCDGRLIAKHVLYLEGPQRCLNLRRMRFVPRTLHTLKGTSKNVAISLRFARIVGVGCMDEDF